MTGRLAGKVAVITGTGSGQGRAAALLFAAEGATVIGCDRDAVGAARTVELASAAGYPVTSHHPLDLTNEEEVAAFISVVDREYGLIDILYNNAGATRFSPIEETDAADWSFVLRHELDLVFLPTKHAWPLLRKSGRSSVVLVGSTAGVSGSMTNPRVAHTATKGGIVAMTKQMAAEGAPWGIRVNCVSPGMIRTAATENDLLADDHPMSKIARFIPMGRVGTAEEVARCALFLASDDSSYVTGTNLMVDGGWSAVLPGQWNA